MYINTAKGGHSSEAVQLEINLPNEIFIYKESFKLFKIYRCNGLSDEVLRVY